MHTRTDRTRIDKPQKTTTPADPTIKGPGQHNGATHPTPPRKEKKNRRTKIQDSSTPHDTPAKTGTPRDPDSLNCSNNTHHHPSSPRNNKKTQAVRVL